MQIPSSLPKLKSCVNRETPIACWKENNAHLQIPNSLPQIPNSLPKLKSCVNRETPIACWKENDAHLQIPNSLPQHRSFIHCESPIASWVQRTNYAVPNTLRPWCGGAGPRARVKTTRCRSAGLGPVGPKGLACLNESWNVIVYPLRIFRRRGIHICHENDSWNMGLFTGAGH